MSLNVERIDNKESERNDFTFTFMMKWMHMIIEQEMFSSSKMILKSIMQQIFKSFKNYQFKS